MHIHTGRSFRMALWVLVALVSPLLAGERWTLFSNYTGIHRIADAGRHLWMASSGGLIRLDKATGDKAYFNQTNSALPGSRVQALASDGLGRIWAAGQDGSLVEFDGTNWSNLSSPGPLSGVRSIDLDCDGRGSLWVLALDTAEREMSLFRRKEGAWTRFYLNISSYDVYFVRPGIASLGVFGPSRIYLQVDAEGIVWVVLDQGYSPKVYRLGPKGQTDTVSIPYHIFPERKLGHHYPLTFIAPKSGDPFWIGSGIVARSSANGWVATKLPDSAYPGNNSPHPSHLYARTSDGTEYWALNRLLKSRNGIWEEVDLPDDAFGAKGRLLVSGREGGSPLNGHKQWLAMGSQIGYLVQGGWRPFHIGKTPLGTDGLTWLFPGTRASSDVYVIANGRKMSPFDFSTGALSAPLELGIQGAASTSFSSWVEDHQGRIWIQGQSRFGQDQSLTKGWLARLGPDGTRTFTSDNSPWMGWTRRHPGNLAADDRGTVWAADSNRLWAIPGGTYDTSAWKIHAVTPPGTRIQGGIAWNKDGSIWATLQAPRNGFALPARYAGNTWRVFGSEDHPSIGGYYSGLLCDGGGNVWAISLTHLLQWDGNVWTEHRPPNVIRATAIDTAGHLWIATRPPTALVKWKSGHWNRVEEPTNKLSSSAIDHMAFDASGRLWTILNGNSLMVFDPAGTESEPASLPPLKKSRVRGIGRKPSIAKTPDGRWRIFPGILGGEESLGIQLLDLRGRAVPGTGWELRPARPGEWLWSGPEGDLGPGRYLLRLQGQTQRVLLPFQTRRP